MKRKQMKKGISALLAVVLTGTMATGFSTAKAETKTAIDIVNEMGMGCNLGNSFDCNGGSKRYFSTGWIDEASWNEHSTETLWGNPITTKEMIDAIHAQGFDSIRIPVTWGDLTVKIFL